MTSDNICENCINCQYERAHGITGVCLIVSGCDIDDEIENDRDYWCEQFERR